MDPSNILGFPQNQLVQLQDDCARQMEKIREHRDFYMEKLGDAETVNQGLEKRNVILIGRLEKMNIAMQELMAERDSYKMEIQVIKEDAERIREHHAKELNDKNRMIHNQGVCLNSEVQKYAEKLKVLQEQHVEQIEDMDLELKTLEDELVAGQEQHIKELNEKDLKIQELETRLSAAKQQTTDQLVEFTNEKDRLSLDMQKLQEECLKAERSLQDVRVMLKEVQQQKVKEVIPDPTELHIELGKLYMELQEAKKPQEARLAAKNKEMEYVTKQNVAKLAAKDSEIQNLAEIVKEGEEKNKNREEMITNLRKIMFAMEYENTEMRKKTKKGAAPSDSRAD
ncbi:hypothetical protein CRE_01253 [Caenorhabditis remanei]|uniref:Uncharacterized protein n=1 Tax=Caenorhabditis remanei TaxID=31234 RepID=E3N9K9_CAERE|nr:hypothetical protein CRE_01253 [Caenorhabditis remanei]